MTNSANRPKWHLIYYLLAAIDILTIGGSLYLNHSVLAIYRESVEINQQWAIHLANFLRVSDLAQQVNAPGNDVFDSHDVDKELAVRAKALAEFETHMTMTRQALSTAPAGTPFLADLGSSLDQIEIAMARMMATADSIFVHFRDNDPERAAKFMAAMDRSYANVTQNIGEAQRLVQEIQLGNSETQLSAARRLGQFEYLIGFVILVIVNLVIIYGHKIKSAMVAAESKRRELIERLTVSEAAAHSHLHDAIDNMNEGFALFDAEERLAISNARYRDFLGVDADVVRPGGFLRDILGASARRHRPDESEARTAEWIGQQLRLYRNADGVVPQNLFDGRWIQLCCRRTRDGGTVAICADVTSLKEQELQLRDNERRLNEVIADMNESRLELKAMAAQYAEVARENREQRESAEAASAAKTQFLANVSHELRTPLNAIIGFSDIMRKEMIGPLGSAKYHQYVSDIHESGGHLLTLINDLLDLAKIEAHKHQLDEDACSLGEIIEAGTRLLSERAGNAGLRLVSEIDAALPLVRADERKLKQILLNLLSNAMKFTPEGGTITVRAGPRGDGGTMLSVTDSGIGIPPQKLTQVLEPFVQVESAYSRRHAGTGLGLPLCKAFAELHGGALHLESALGAGTTVTLTLPAERTIAPAANERLQDSTAA
jgi:signal transduction histidine kinase